MSIASLGRAGGRDADETRWQIVASGLRLDFVLLTLVALTAALGLVVLYSAGSGSTDLLMRQGVRFAIGFGALLVLAQVPIDTLRAWSPWAYAGVVVLLLCVMAFGDASKGAQRWLDFGFVRFQPSEMMKLAMPMMLAWYFSDKALPPRPVHLLIAGVLLAVPVALIGQQPDLGTAVLVAASGVFVIFLAGIYWRQIAALAVLGLAGVPAMWYFMQDYQRQRILTLLNPEADPLGSGYHIIQSKIAIGSGGLYGKGWLNGTQSQLDFIPERATDFIFAVYGEEFGLLGAVLLLTLYVLIVLRGLTIAARAQDTFSRLLAGSLCLSFFVYCFVNIGMVTGLMPVVGVPLPLVSYGGTSIVTLMAAFGILMAIQSYRRLLAR